MAAVVVKVGSTSITTAAGGLSENALAALVDELVAVAEAGARPILVSSGAIAAGRGALGGGHERDIEDLQGLAAIGQGLLMARYARLFGARDRLVGQVLLTGHDFGERLAYLNARRTLTRLLDWGVVPVVNENDTTATDEISLGENDRLAALVATLVQADLLVILTDTRGIHSADPRLSSEASLIDEVTDVDAELEAAAGGSSSGIGSGGMASKVAAAKIATWSGIGCVIASAAEPGVVRRALAGQAVGTRVRPRARRLAARKVWVAFARPPRGRLLIDDGAVRALVDRGHSLLPVGIHDVDGVFEAGDAVEICDLSGRLVAKGLAASAAAALRVAAGQRRSETAAGVPPEAVHRDDLVVLTE